MTAQRVLRALGIVFAVWMVLQAWAALFLNVGLPVLLGTQPERFDTQHAFAWMSRPGEVHVRGLRIRSQGPRDQWYLEVDRATLRFDLQALRDRQVRITQADASGAIFWWRPRADAPGADASPGEASPPIPGLEDPPACPPEDLYAKVPRPWGVVLEDVRITDVRELWIGDHRFTGVAEVSGSLEVEPRAWFEARSVVLTLTSGEVSRALSPVLTDVRGEARLDYAGTDLGSTDAAPRPSAISGTVVLDANTRDLRFLDFYLRDVPWLRLSQGLGKLAVDVRIENGSFVDGSSVEASITDLVAQILFFTVSGTGNIAIAVDSPNGEPQMKLRVALPDYRVHIASEPQPQVEGQDLVVTATTPDVAIDMPFSSIELDIDVPESKVLEFASYNAYLPHGMGLSLGSGTGSVRAHVSASRGGDFSGELYLEGHAVNLDLDEVAMVGDVMVHGMVPSGNLVRGVYDISGSSVALRGLQVRSGSSEHPGRDDSDGWWGRAAVPTGQISEAAPTFLVGTVVLTARDTVPLVTLFAERHTVPGWLRRPLTTGPVKGSAVVSMGQNLLRASQLDLSAGNFRVLGEIRRRDHTAGKLHVQFGMLSMALGITHPKTKVHLINTRRWYDAEPNPN